MRGGGAGLDEDLDDPDDELSEEDPDPDAGGLIDNDLADDEPGDDL